MIARAGRILGWAVVALAVVGGGVWGTLALHYSPLSPAWAREIVAALLALLALAALGSILVAWRRPTVLIVFVLAFLAAGHASVPRRYAAHLPQWVPYDQAGSIGAILMILGMLFFAGRITAGLLRAPVDGGPAHPRG